MLKHADFLVEFKDKIKSEGIEISDELKPSNKLIKRFIKITKKIPDPRCQAMIEYPLKDILLIAFLATLAGAETWVDFEEFAKMQGPWLKRFLKNKGTIPSHDTFRRVFSLLDPLVMQQMMIEFLLDNLARLKATFGIKDDKARLINIDGKQARGTGRSQGINGGHPNFQMFHVLDASNSICLYSKQIDEKTNEIPTAPEVLKLCNIKKAVVTCDALNTQKNTVSAVVEGKGNYVFALKQNHQDFYDDVKTYFTDEQLKKIKQNGVKFFTSIDKAHSQIERRNFYLSTNIKWFEDKEQWEKLRGFVCYEKIITKIATGEVTIEKRYFITSLIDIDTISEAIREHWSVENKLHWHLDVTFADDADMTIDKAAYQNYSLMRKMALNIYKIAQATFPKHKSIRSIRKGFGWNYEKSIAIVLNAVTPETLADAICVNK